MWTGGSFFAPMPIDPREIRIADYTYPLPEARIARYPLPDRSAARLLQYHDGKISSHTFRELPALLPPGTLLIGNQTRVIHARLRFTLATGKPLEIFCLEPLQPTDYAQSLGSLQAVSWKCLIGGNRRWKSGQISQAVLLDGREVILTAERTGRTDDAFTVTFSWRAATPVSFGEVVAAAGTIPLPPYLNRESEDDDRQRYQTVFAREEGSVAAPTAGLHFTPAVMEQLRERDVDFRTLTLHVGAGTFKPVTSDTLGGHPMHREYFSVPVSLLERLVQQSASGLPIVSIGTTSMRCLESLYYFGARLLEGQPFTDQLDQWVASDARSASVHFSPACSALIDELRRRKMAAFSGYTQLLLTPAVQPRVVDGLITNFHQPQSTLLLLVASVIGEDWRRVYDYALGHDYRFLSYGDSSLLWRRGGAQ